MNPLRFSLIIVLAVVPTIGLIAQPVATTLEARLAQLEAQLNRLEARLNQTVSADELAPAVKQFNELSRQLGWDGKSPLNVTKAAGSETKISVEGFVQANFESGTAPDSRWTGINDRFLLRRARLFVAGAFAEDVSFKVESDFGNNSIAPKTGLSGQLTDAYLAWTKFPAASFRLGQFKTPFGFEQLASDTKIYTIERSLPNDKLTLGRQIGAMISGDVLGKRASYALGAYNGTGTNIGSNDSEKFLWAGRVSAAAFEGKAANQKIKLTTGANYFTTVDQGAFTGRRFGSGLDAQLGFGPGELQAEWLRNDQHATVGRPAAAEGWALLGKLDLTKQWQVVTRFETFDSNTATPATTTNLWTYGLNYLLKGDDVKFSLDYLSGRQPAPASRGERLLGRMQVMF